MKPAAAFKRARDRLTSGAGVFERTLWFLGVGVFLAASGLTLATQISPAAAHWAQAADVLGASIASVASSAQAATIVIGLAATAVIMVFGRNPAQSIAETVKSSAGGPVESAGLFADLADLFEHDAPPTWSDVLRFPASADDDAALAALNASCFETSATYGGEVQAKLARNAALTQAYRKCFAFVVGEPGVLGFSSVIPLNADACELYLAGKVSDHDIRAMMLARPGADRLAGVLLFAVGLDPKYEAARGGTRNPQFIETLVRAHALHVKSVLDDFPEAAPKLIIQAEKASIMRFIRTFGFQRSGLQGADGDALFVAEIAGIRRALASLAQHRQSEVVA